MLFALVIACVPPTTYGIRSDGSIGLPGSGELALGAGNAGGLQDGVFGVGASGAYTVADHVAVEGALGWVPSEGKDDIFAMELGARTRLSGDDEGLTLTTVEDLSLSYSQWQEGVILGARLGVIGSYGARGPLRPYLGFTVTPALYDRDLWWYTHLGLGLSARGAMAEGRRLKVTAELDWTRSWTLEGSVFGGLVGAGVEFGR